VNVDPAADLALIATLPAGYGYLEGMQERDGHLHVHGWLCGLDAPCDAFWLVTGTGQAFAMQRWERPDLAAGAGVPADRAPTGFSLSGPIPGFDERGVFAFTIVGMRGGRPFVKMTAGYHRPRSPQPFPPAAMQHRATSQGLDAYWQATGMKCCHDYLRVLARHTSLDALRNVMDWGSGAGRVTFHLIDRLPNADVAGNDIDHEAIAWAAAHLDGTFTPGSPAPPLPCADGAFDLVIATSVFTHLTADYQERWLAELHRVVAPDGLLLATTHGEFAGRWAFRDADLRQRVFAAGICSDLADHNLGDIAPETYYRGTFQSAEWTRHTWGRLFRVLDHVEGGMGNFQDIFVLRRR